MRVFTVLVFLISISFGCNSYITSGPKNRNYYSFAQKLSAKSGNSICVRSSSGTPRNIYNIIDEPKVSLGLFQADILKSAKIQYDYKGKLKDVELLFPITKEQVHFIIRKGSRFRTLKSLKKKEIAVGSKLSGSYLTFLFLSKQFDIDWEDENYPFETGLSKLDNGEVDAVFVVGKAPIAGLKGRYDFINITQPVIGYDKAIINKNIYQTANDIQTLSTDTLLVVNNKKLGESDKSDIKKLVKTYIQMKLDASKVKINAKNIVDEKVQKFAEGITDFFKSTVQGEDLAGKKRKNKLQKVQSICQLNIDSVKKYGLKRSQIAIEACREFEEEVKKEKFTNYEFY